MSYSIIHISDLHFRKNLPEEHGLVISEFFKDLAVQVQNLDAAKCFLVFSGDIVHAGQDWDEYQGVLDQLDLRLTEIGIPRSHRICVPGNHDVSSQFVAEHKVEIDGVLQQELSEKQFNDYVASAPELFLRKFDNYIRFQNQFAEIGISNAYRSGGGWKLDDGCCIYCLNSAWCSAGSYGNDSGRLAVDTRSLHEWVQDNRDCFKILVMHHPVSWLPDWAAKEIEKLLRGKFSLCLSGHVHDQDFVRSERGASSIIECCAPPLHTSKDGELGYSIISLGLGNGPVDVAFRQWSPRHKFVLGVNFSGTDDGKVRLESRESHRSLDAEQVAKNAVASDVAQILESELQRSLTAFNGQPSIWVDPVLAPVSEAEYKRIKMEGDAENYSVPGADEIKLPEMLTLDELISGSKSTLIKAPPQFGQTCVARYLSLYAWRTGRGLWLYLDGEILKPHSTEKAINSGMRELSCTRAELKGIILDSWSIQERWSIKVLEKLCKLCPDTPIIVMQRTADLRFPRDADLDSIDRKFDTAYLWPLRRENVRRVIAGYNEHRYIGDEDAVLGRVLADLQVLNLHRTPLNCLTLLKVSEAQFEDSPINRTEMIHRVLFLMFNLGEIPNYAVRPDLKDCEFVLGYFCEQLIRKNEFMFSRDAMLNEMRASCNSSFIDLDVHVVFDVLHANNIIMQRGDDLCFRFSYWIYYFVAQRMHQNSDFASFVFSNKRYSAYPEVLEFYTGIDRRRNDALSVLLQDLSDSYSLLDAKCGFPLDMNPYALAQWRPSPGLIEQLQEEVGEDVAKSKLPDAVKDQYADRSYDPAKPYDQRISGIYEEYSLAMLVRVMSAATRALRNSDFADPTLKQKVLDQILMSWDLILKVILVLTPMLAEKGRASFEGYGFYVAGLVTETPEKRFYTILNCIPRNVIHWYKDDFFSQKIGPLLIAKLLNETNRIKKHFLVLLLISNRPRGWKANVERYISDTNKNSWYLLDVYRALDAEYQYSFATHRELGSLGFLIKMALAKHQLGAKKPGVKMIGKIDDSVLPTRHEEE